MADQLLHVAVLRLLERKVAERRVQHMEAMTKGLRKRDYLQRVGRAAECKELGDLIEDVLKRLRDDDLNFDDEGIDDDEDISVGAPAGRTRQRRQARARTRR